MHPETIPGVITLAFDPVNTSKIWNAIYENVFIAHYSNRNFILLMIL